MPSPEETKTSKKSREGAETKESPTLQPSSEVQASKKPEVSQKQLEQTTSETKGSKKKRRSFDTRTSRKSARSSTTIPDKSETETKTPKKSREGAERRNEPDISSDAKKGEQAEASPHDARKDPPVAEMPPPGGHTTGSPVASKTDGMNVFKKRLVAVGILICIGCIIAMSVFVHAVGGTRQATRNLPCVGQECHEVVEFTESLMDHNVNPCSDFYRHVCGRWINNTKRPSSFMIDVAKNFSETLHEVLVRAHVHGENHELMQNAAIFYNSCITYLKADADIQASTDELFKALNISISKWLTETNPMQFFREVLRLSLVNRFHTLLAFSVIDDKGNMSLKVRRYYPLHIYATPDRKENFHEYMNRFIKVIGKDYASDTVVEEVLSLDKNRKNVTEDGEPEMRLSEIECQSFPGKTWIEVLQKELSLPENVSIITVGINTICGELSDVLVNTKSAARALYIMALVSRSVLQQDYMLSDNRDAYAVRNACYQMMRLAFEDTWLHLLSSLLSINKGIEEIVDVYVTTIAEEIKSRVANWTWMADEDRRAALEKLARIRLVRFYGASMTKQAVQCSSGRKVTSAGFVSNVVNLYVRDLKNCLFLSVDRSDDLGLEELLLGTNLMVHSAKFAVVVPPMFAVPPMFYRHVEDDKFINVAVLGIQLVRKVLSLIVDRGARTKGGATAGWSNSTLTVYSAFQDCYARESAKLHAKLNDDQFDHAFSVMESLRIAYAVKRRYDRDIVSRKKPRLVSSNSMLYKRACLTLCTAQGAPRDGNTLDFETAYASGLLAAANAPMFIDIFGCQAGDTMAAINSCHVH
ncbi:neprilysin-1-like isoform X2 [Dermacentor albipictus]|uniref:neprilysin-1-like isoform X2 n=1 Tax=Dermacentor albipictus TaxID=60249 RepID=UPI0031FCCF6B